MIQYYLLVERQEILINDAILLSLTFQISVSDTSSWTMRGYQRCCHFFEWATGGAAIFFNGPVLHRCWGLLGTALILQVNQHDTILFVS